MNEAASEEFLTLHEVVAAARARLPGDIWHYVAGAAETETTARRNRLAIEALALRPRVLRNVAAVDCAREFLGRRVRLPVALAPIGGLESLAPEGGASVARAAHRFGVPMFLSSAAQPGLETVAEAAPDGFRIFQLYVRGDTAWVNEIGRRAADAGYAAFCITVDTAHYSRRERDIARRMVKPWRAVATGQEFQAAFDWEDAKRFRDAHAMPFILKGISTPQDAARACEIGADVVYVSNHGGRQLDHGIASIDALREVVPAVAGRARIMVDGGFYRGTDVVKALCLGADMVGLGRLPCFGMAAGGEAGLVRTLEILEDELRIDLGLLGAAALAELNSGFVQAGFPVGDGTLESAFPLLRPGSH